MQVSYSVLLLVGFVVLIVFAIFVTAIVLLLFRRGGRGETADEDEMSLDVSALKPDPIPQGGLQLEVYGTPVRIMVMVIAPAGRAAPPSKEELPGIVDALSPGMMQVVSLHQPLFRKWPQQLSTSGFAHAFFNKMALPGDRGKGTPWCSICGRLTASGRPLLLGLVCAADDANALGEITVEHEGQWLSVLRVTKR